MALSMVVLSFGGGSSSSSSGLELCGVQVCVCVCVCVREAGECVCGKLDERGVSGGII